MVQINLDAKMCWNLVWITNKMQQQPRSAIIVNMFGYTKIQVQVGLLHSNFPNIMPVATEVHEILRRYVVLTWKRAIKGLM